MVQRYHHAPGINKMYSLPMPTKASVGHHEWYGYVFMLVGFRFMVTLDPRPFPPEYTSYVLNGNTVRVAPSLTSQRPTRLSRCANSPPSTISVRLGPNRLHDDPAGPGGGRVIFLDPGEYRGWRRRGTFTAAGATETAADMTRLFGQPLSMTVIACARGEARRCPCPICGDGLFSPAKTVLRMSVDGVEQRGQVPRLRSALHIPTRDRTHGG